MGKMKWEFGLRLRSWGVWRWRVRSLEGPSEPNRVSLPGRTGLDLLGQEKLEPAPEQCTKDMLADSSLGLGSSSTSLACVYGNFGAFLVD